MAKYDLTAESIRELLAYDPITGIFIWSIGGKGFRAGDIAGTLTRYGYVDIMIKKSNYKAHRLAWIYTHGEWPIAYIDHIDGVRSNNSIGNLREANKSENGQNIKTARVDSSTGFLGVNRVKNRWRAIIQFAGKPKHLGYFDSPEDAHAAYVEAKRELHPFCTI